MSTISKHNYRYKLDLDLHRIEQDKKFQDLLLDYYKLECQLQERIFRKTSSILPPITLVPIKNSPTLTHIKNLPTLTPIKKSPTLTPIKNSPTLVPIKKSPKIPIKNSPTLTPIKTIKNSPTIENSNYFPLKHSPVHINSIPSLHI